jgi:putative flippase GtrA
MRAEVCLSKLSSFVSNNHDEFTRFLKFGLVGTLGAAVDFGVLNLLVLVFGVPKEYANLVSVSCAIFSNFIWNRLWTFPESRDHPLHISFGKFALVNLFGLAINQFVFVTADAIFFAPTFPHPLDYNLAKGCAILVVLFWNFFANRRWTYREI